MLDAAQLKMDWHKVLPNGVKVWERAFPYQAKHTELTICLVG